MRRCTISPDASADPHAVQRVHRRAPRPPRGRLQKLRPGARLGGERREQRPGDPGPGTSCSWSPRPRAPAIPPTRPNTLPRPAPSPAPPRSAACVARRQRGSAAHPAPSSPPSRKPPLASKPTERAPRRRSSRYRRDDEGRADPGAPRPGRTSRTLERRLDVRPASRPRRRRGSAPPACRRCRRARSCPVSSAISGRSPSPSVETIASSRCSRDPAADGAASLGASPRCRPARTRRSARARTPRRRAAREASHDQIAATGAVLVDPDPEALRAARRRGRRVARDVALADAGPRLRRAAGRRRQRRPSAATIPGLVGLGDLSGRAVELEAVAIGRDVAAGDHDRRSAAAQPPQRQRRGRQHAAIDRRRAGGPTAARQAAAIRAARPQVPADQHLAEALAPAADVEKGAT